LEDGASGKTPRRLVAEERKLRAAAKAAAQPS
jgi:hypothetical protein